MRAIGSESITDKEHAESILSHLGYETLSLFEFENFNHTQIKDDQLTEGKIRKSIKDQYSSLTDFRNDFFSLLKKLKTYSCSFYT